jgi:hypothetical protein
MKLLAAILILLFRFVPLQALQADVIDDMTAHFKQGNFREIGKNFATTVELIIVDQEDVYSKAQSEQILKDFFLKNSPTKADIVHRFSNNRGAVLNLYTKNGRFRVTVTMAQRKPSNQFQITELRIEQDKQ